MLHYHRCDDCLTAFSTVEKHVDYCDCTGTVTYMGEVHADKYKKMGTKAACDGRCTHASGPVCDCFCGGVNHGTGKLVQCVIAEGKTKIVGLSPEDVERAENYRSLKKYAEDIYAAKLLSEFGKANCYGARQELNHALSMRVYDKRTKALIDFVTKYKV